MWQVASEILFILNSEKMEKLKLQFIKKKFKYTQMWRDDNWAIYLKENDVPKVAENYFFRYELVKIRIQREDIIRKVFGKELTTLAGEYYPNDNEWGLYGWTCFTEKEAMELKVRKQAFLSGRKQKGIVRYALEYKSALTKNGNVKNGELYQST